MPVNEHGGGDESIGCVAIFESFHGSFQHLVQTANIVEILGELGAVAAGDERTEKDEAHVEVALVMLSQEEQPILSLREALEGQRWSGKGFPRLVNLAVLTRRDES